MQGSGEECSGRDEDEIHGWQHLLDRSWLLRNAATETTKVVGRDGRWRRSGDVAQGCGDGGSSFHVIRDDLLHPVMGGNKLRKLDALIPLLQAHGVTDVVRLATSHISLPWERQCMLVQLLCFCGASGNPNLKETLALWTLKTGCLQP